VIAPVDPRAVAPLQAALEHVAQNPAQNDYLPFAALGGCHFARFLLLPGGLDLQGDSYGPQLLFLSDCDGSASDHLEAVVDAAGPGLDQLFGRCEGYPDKPSGRAERLSFMRKRRVRIKANYVHRQGRSVEQIRREDQLRHAIQGFTRAASFTGMSALAARERIRSFVQNDNGLRWALEPAPGVDLLYRARLAVELAAVIAGACAVAPWAAPAALTLLGLVRMQESSDPCDHIRPTPEHVAALARIEDHYAHNAFTAGGFAKPGWLRQTVIAGALPLIGFGARQLFTRDSLAGVRTIHFARWIPLDGGRRVVFCSNYDGSLDSYNNDFIDLVAWGLNLIFSNGYGYPRTRWLVFGGASREVEFKDYLRRHQIPTPVWYSAYPQLSAANIVRNAELRAGLHGQPNEREAQRWLRLV
jgi:hypothetical protein